jgi:hypothetical protein
VRLFALAARRFATLLLLVAGVTAAVSILIGLALGADVPRSLAVGFYLTGCFFVVAGFFLGARGPIRLAGASGSSLLGTRLRWLSPSEREEGLSSAALFVSIGFALIGLGVLSDTRYPLV